MNRSLRLAAASLAFVFALTAVPALAAEPAVGTVNVNTATASELTLLPRIGPAVAQRILEFRQANGPFKKAQDLMLVRGIGEKTFALLEPHVSVSGATTLKEKVRTPRSQAGRPATAE